MAAKHTPGPWAVDSVADDSETDIVLGYQIPNAGHPILLGTAFGDDDAGPGRIHPSEARANARIMAAAPDLLTGLELMLAAWDEENPGAKCECCAAAPDDIVSPAPCSMCVGRAAIAKARGEQ